LKIITNQEFRSMERDGVNEKSQDLSLPKMRSTTTVGQIEKSFTKLTEAC